MSRSALLLMLLAAPIAAQVTPPVPPISPVPSVPLRLDQVNRNLDINLGNLDLNLSRLQSSIDLNLSNSLAWRTSSLDALNGTLGNWTSDLSSPFWSVGSTVAPAPWAKDDPADSLYRAARESLNHGDYRKAAAQFDDITKRFPKSAYVKDAPYWLAFALYRIGGTQDLTEALALLDKWRTDNPAPAKTATSRNSSNIAFTYTSSSNWSEDSGRPDVDGLSARIAGVLATRGMADNASVKRALAARGDACDTEDQSVKAEALSAVMQSSAEQGRALAAKILGRRDECSVPLRRNALLVLGRQHDASTVATLVTTAKNDPSVPVRTEAIDLLSRESGDDALNALDELWRNSDSKIQRAAIAAIGDSRNPRARTLLRAVVDRSETTEPVRINALDGFSKENSTADDATWMRNLYPKSTLRVQEAIVSTIGRIGGDVNNQWLLTLARNEEVAASVRSMVLQRLGRTMDIATLNKVYESATTRQMRESVISLLSSRNEPEAVDKLIEIVKNGTDPSVRKAAISALAKSKDPRAIKLLLDLVDK